LRADGVVLAFGYPFFSHGIPLVADLRVLGCGCRERASGTRSPTSSFWAS
jgi:hypothetical protein